MVFDHNKKYFMLEGIWGCWYTVAVYDDGGWQSRVVSRFLELTGRFNTNDVKDEDAKVAAADDAVTLK